MEFQATALTDRVRALVREHRIDPGLNADAVDALARTVVEDHDRQSLSGAVDPIEHPELVVRQIVADLSGLGPLQPLVDDPSVEEIWINEPDRVFIARDGRPELTSIILTAMQVRELIERMLSSSGRRLDISRPFVDATLPGGHRLHVVLQGISREFAAVNIRKYVAKADNLAGLVDGGTLDMATAEFLSRAVADGTNIIVSGGTQAGKPTNSQYTQTLLRVRALPSRPNVPRHTDTGVMGDEVRHCFSAGCAAQADFRFAISDGGADLWACDEHVSTLRHTIDCAMGWCKDPGCDGSFVDPDFEPDDDLP